MKYRVIDIARYDVEADSLEEAADKFRKIMGDTSDLSDAEWSKLVDEVVFSDGEIRYEEN